MDINNAEDEQGPTGIIAAKVLSSSVLFATSSQVHHHRRVLVGTQKAPNDLFTSPQSHRLVGEG